MSAILIALYVILWTVGIILIWKRVKRGYYDRFDPLGLKEVALRNVWQRYEDDDQISFTIFKRFMRELIPGMEIKDNTLLTLWNAMGYTLTSTMDFEGFQKLFETAMGTEHDSPQKIKDIIKGRLKQLLAITLKAEHLLKPEGASQDSRIKIEDLYLRILKKETKNAVENTSESVTINSDEIQQKELAHVVIDIDINQFSSTMKHTRRNSIKKEIWQEV